MTTDGKKLSVAFDAQVEASSVEVTVRSVATELSEASSTTHLITAMTCTTKTCEKIIDDRILTEASLGQIQYSLSYGDNLEIGKL